MAASRRSDSGLEKVIQDVVGEELVDMMKEDSLHVQRRLNALAKYLGVANIPGKTWEELNEDVAKKWEKMVSSCNAEFATTMSVYNAPLMFQYRDSAGHEWCLDMYDILRTAEERKGWFKTEIVFRNPINGEVFDELLVARLRWQMEMFSFIYQATPDSLSKLTDKLARRLDFDDVSMANAKTEAAQRIAVGFAWLSLVAITPGAIMSVPVILAGGLSVQKYFIQIVRDIVKGSILNNTQKPTSKVAAILLKTMGLSGKNAGPSKTETLYDPRAISELPDRAEMDRRRASSVSVGSPTLQECAGVCPPCPRRSKGVGSSSRVRAKRAREPYSGSYRRTRQRSRGMKRAKPKAKRRR